MEIYSYLWTGSQPYYRRAYQETGASDYSTEDCRIGDKRTDQQEAVQPIIQMPFDAPVSQPFDAQA